MMAVRPRRSRLGGYWVGARRSGRCDAFHHPRLKLVTENGSLGGARRSGGRVNLNLVAGCPGEGEHGYRLSLGVFGLAHRDREQALEIALPVGGLIAVLF